MNENEHKSGGGPRVGSLFSFLKPVSEDFPPAPPTAQQAARPAGPSPEVAGLKARMGEMEEKLRRLENSASSGAVPSDSVARLPELERRLAALENAVAPGQPGGRPPEDDSKYVQMIGKAEAALRALLESDRCKAGETAAAMEEKLGRLESGFTAAGGMLDELKAKLEGALSALENVRGASQAAERMEAEHNAASAAQLERGLRELKDALEPRLCAAEKAVVQAVENEERRGEAGLAALKDFKSVLDVYGRELRQVRDGTEAQSAALNDALYNMKSLLAAEGEKRDEVIALAASRLEELKREIAEEQAELRRGMDAFKKASDEAREKAEVLEKSIKETVARLDSSLSEERVKRGEDAVGTAERMAGLERALAVQLRETTVALSELRPGAEVMKGAMAEDRERLEILERALKENSKYFRSLLSEEGARHEEAAAGIMARLTGLEQMLAEDRGGAAVAAAEWKRSAVGLREEMSALKLEIVAAAESAFREVRARLEAVAARIREEIIAAAKNGLSSLESQLEAAEAEVKAAHKTAFIALEKCEKLDRNMVFIEQKSASLERRYYRYIEEDPAKPANNA